MRLPWVNEESCDSGFFSGGRRLQPFCWPADWLGNFYDLRPLGSSYDRGVDEAYKKAGF